MRGVHIDRQVCLYVDPTAKNTTTGKYERVRPLSIDHRQFKIVVERCGRYVLPIHSTMLGQLFGLGFDPHQVCRAESDGSLGAEVGAARPPRLPFRLRLTPLSFAGGGL
jgi:hypothetical protein